MDYILEERNVAEILFIIVHW